jgi:hypothetical protein
VKEIHPEASDLDGYEDIGEENQAKIIKAWQEGHVAEEDIPESARKKPADDEDAEGEGSEKKKPTRKRGPAKKKVGIFCLALYWFISLILLLDLPRMLKKVTRLNLRQRSVVQRRRFVIQGTTL